MTVIIIVFAIQNNITIQVNTFPKGRIPYSLGSFGILDLLQMKYYINIYNVYNVKKYQVSFIFKPFGTREFEVFVHPTQVFKF